MAIEPLGSMMSLQNQSTLRTQFDIRPQQTESTDAVSTEAAKLVDATTAGVVETQAQQKSPDGQTGNSQNGGNDYIQTFEQKQDKIKKAVEQMNKNMNNSEAIFGIHEGTNRVTIKIVDKDTKKVIKELPPEKTLDMIAKVWEMAGIMVDEKR